MRDLRGRLDSAQLSWLECLERVIGGKAVVAVGYEGEPLHFSWDADLPDGDREMFEVSFEDDDHLSFYWWTTIPEPEGRAYDSERGIAFGRIPANLVADMKRFKNVLAKA